MLFLVVVPLFFINGDGKHLLFDNIINEILIRCERACESENELKKDVVRKLIK